MDRIVLTVKQKLRARNAAAAVTYAAAWLPEGELTSHCDNEYDPRHVRLNKAELQSQHGNVIVTQFFFPCLCHGLWCLYSRIIRYREDQPVDVFAPYRFDLIEFLYC